MSFPHTVEDSDFDDVGQPGRRRTRDARAVAAVAADNDPLLRAVFLGATFLGAFLLFLVQPMVAKFMLPWFGGGQAVWTTCILFFQTVLLAGYGYAHFIVRRVSPARQAWVHVTLLAAAVGVAGVVAAWHPARPAPGVRVVGLHPLPQILLMLTAAAGLPAFALSATSPLLNAWWARAGVGSVRGTYRLYAVSNAGSFLALLAYPFVVEPRLARGAQLNLWSTGLGIFSALCGWSALAARGISDPRHAGARTPDADDPSTPRTRGITRILWLALPACASAMLLATTNTMANDVAAVPLLWVMPLGLYLLTFVIAFDAERWYRRGMAGPALAVAALGVCALLLGVDARLTIGMRVALLAAAMFLACLVCHGELAALKPPPFELTTFYLCVAAGGMVGGAAVAVAAPLVLDRYAELHLALWACCAAGLVARWVVGLLPGRAGASPSGLIGTLSVSGLVILAWLLWCARDPYAYAGGIVTGRWRDFYGVVTLYETHRDDPGRAALLFRHSGVTHGMQFLSPEKRRRPTTYFGPSSGAGVSLSGPIENRGGRRVGVVGLGAGTLAAYGRRGDFFRFYEISPAVIRVARERFTFLADSDATCEIIPGDGRLALEREPPQQFDVLILDAFSGHAIPTHLLTAEAFTLYRHHLAPGGVVAVNVTNRFVDIEPVVARHAAHHHWVCLRISSENATAPATGNTADTNDDGLLPADWLLLTDAPQKISAFRRAGGVPARDDLSLRRWTDDFASLYPVLRW